MMSLERGILVRGRDLNEFWRRLLRVWRQLETPDHPVSMTTSIKREDLMATSTYLCLGLAYLTLLSGGGIF